MASTYSINLQAKLDTTSVQQELKKLRSAQQIVDKFSEILGIKPGETTEDGLFTIDALRCIGACAIAPAVTINGKVYPHVEVSEVQGIVDEYKAKEAAEA